MSDHSHSQHAEEADDGKVHAHISSVGFYAAILSVLMFLTLLTVAVSYVHLGPLNLAVAIVIASIKAGLVVTFFMHLRHDSRFNSMILVVSLLFIGVFFAYTLNDTGHRGQLDSDQGGRIQQSTGLEAPGGMEKAAEHEEGAPAASGEHHEEGSSSKPAPAPAHH